MYAFSSAAGPVREGFLPLGELTAVIAKPKLLLVSLGSPREPRSCGRLAGVFDAGLRFGFGRADVAYAG